MKKGCIIFLLSFIISVTTLGFTGVLGGEKPADEYTQYLRIHIRADSNEREAQAVKYLVRDKIVDYLTPVVADCHSVENAVQEVEKRLPQMEYIAQGVLGEHGFFYGARATVRREVFPTRVYGEYTLPQGEYLALIIELGEGEGDNWWCVAYPPLCFTATQNVVYKSKILEIIDEWKNR